VNKYHCPHCFTKYTEEQEGFNAPPQEGDFMVCGRCGHGLVFRWHEESEGLRLERMTVDEFQGLTDEAREGLVKVGKIAALAVRGWEAPRWN